MALAVSSTHSKSLGEISTKLILLPVELVQEPREMTFRKTLTEALISGLGDYGKTKLTMGIIRMLPCHNSREKKFNASCSIVKTKSNCYQCFDGTMIRLPGSKRIST